MICRLIAIMLIAVMLPACAHDVLVEKPAAGFSPPGELMVAPPPLARLDSSKPMPLSDFLEVVSDDTESHLDVAQRLAQLQFWGRTHNGWVQAFDDLNAIVTASADVAAGRTGIDQPAPEPSDSWPNEAALPPNESDPTP